MEKDLPSDLILLSITLFMGLTALSNIKIPTTPTLGMQYAEITPNQFYKGYIQSHLLVQYPFSSLSALSREF